MNTSTAKALLETWAGWYRPKPVPWLVWPAGNSQPPEVHHEWLELLASHTQGAHKQVTRMLEDMADKPPNLLQMRKMLREAEAKVLPTEPDLTPNMGECPLCSGLGWIFDTMTTELGTYTCVNPCDHCGKTGRVPSRQAAKRHVVSLAQWQSQHSQHTPHDEEF